MLKTQDKRLLVTLSLFFILVSLSFVYSADYHDSIPVTSDSGGNIVINPNSCQEDWSGSTWSQCDDTNTQIFICFDKNTCGTEDLKPAQCGETQSCETSTGGDTGGGGGPSGGSPSGGGGGSSGGGTNTVTTTTSTSEESGACVESWVCGEWSNPEAKCGTRVCTDTNNCGTTELEPKTSISCGGGGIFSSVFSFLTGGIVGIKEPSLQKSGGGIAMIALILLIGGFVYFFVKRGESLDGKIKRSLKGY